MKTSLWRQKSIFTINNDPAIKEETSPTTGYKESSIGWLYEVYKVWLGPNEWYMIQPGDTCQFYARFKDEFGNENRIAWTADIVE